MRALLVDDEEGAVSRLRQLCAEHADIAVLGSASHGADAIEKIHTLAPNLLFLDVNLGAISGLDVLKSLAADDAPHVVFVTAYESYAATAFELEAVDYLLKPCTSERFGRAVARVRQRIATGSPALGGEPLLALLRKLVMSAERPDVGRRNGLFVESGDKFVFLESSAIDLVEAARNYVVIHAGKATYCHRASISELERVLDPAHFVRVHKSYLVNFSRVESVQNDFKGAFIFRLSSGASCRSGPTYRERIRSLLRPAERRQES